ncbi:MAG: hypothetical protein V1859_08940 [archaeon]
MAINDIIEKASPKVFDGSDLRRYRSRYERAKQNVETLTDIILFLENVFYDKTSYHKFNLPPEEGAIKYIPENEEGSVRVKVNSEARIKKPAYKQMCEEMKIYLNEILRLLNQKKTITYVRKENGVPYIRVKKVKEAYDSIIKSKLDYTVEHNIETIVKGELENEGTLSRLLIPQIDTGEITQNDLIFYLRAKRLLDDEFKFIKQYDNVLKSRHAKGKKKATIQVSSKHSYGSTRKTSTLPDYPNVVRNIISVPVKTKTDKKGEPIPVGELNQIDDDNISFEEKLNMFNTKYELMQKHLKRDGTVLYVSIPSLYRRIESLLGEEPTVYDSFIIKPKEIIR